MLEMQVVLPAPLRPNSARTEPAVQAKADAMQDVAIAVECVNIRQVQGVSRQDTPPLFVRRQSRHLADHQRSRGRS